MPNSIEECQIEMIKAVAKGVSFIRIGLTELTGVDDPILGVTLKPEAYDALLHFNGGSPDEASEVQFIGVPFTPAKQ